VIAAKTSMVGPAMLWISGYIARIPVTIWIKARMRTIVASILKMVLLDLWNASYVR